MKYLINSSGNGIATPLDASYWKGCGERSGVEREFVVMYYTRQSNSEFIHGEKASALKHRDYKDFTDIVQEDVMEDGKKKYVLRRLTPTECARLQGFPDWWCDGANGSDSAQYRLWGNGIALPCATMILQNIAEDMKEHGQA